MAHFVIGWLRNTSYYLFGSGSSGLGSYAILSESKDGRLSGVVVVGQQHVLKESAEAALGITHVYFENTAHGRRTGIKFCERGGITGHMREIRHPVARQSEIQFPPHGTCLAIRESVHCLAGQLVPGPGVAHHI